MCITASYWMQQLGKATSMQSPFKQLGLKGGLGNINAAVESAEKHVSNSQQSLDSCNASSC